MSKCEPGQIPLSLIALQDTTMAAMGDAVG